MPAMWKTTHKADCGLWYRVAWNSLEQLCSLLRYLGLGPPATCSRDKEQDQKGQQGPPG